MYTTLDIAEQYGIDEKVIKTYLIDSKIPLLNDSGISEKYFQTVLAFIEKTDNRIEKRLEKAQATFKYNSDKNKVSIFQDDAISFLEKLPSNSVDLIVTDPAYSGMNNKLQLGKGRIVGKYSEKGQENGKWFGEFEDSEHIQQSVRCQKCSVLQTVHRYCYIRLQAKSLLEAGTSI